MKRQYTLVTIILVLNLFLSACGKTGETLGRDPVRILDNTEVMPHNIIGVGDSFAYYPSKATGHFICSIMGARVVTEESECPPPESLCGTLLSADVNGTAVNYRYEEWFTEDGAFAHGCRIILVDLMVTNVDAVAYLDNDKNDASCGFFHDPYVFYPHVIAMADLTILEGEEDEPQNFGGTQTISFSQRGQYFQEDDPSSLGYEIEAIRIPPGETVTYTLGFVVHTGSDGTPKDISMMMPYVGADASVDNGVFIDLKLEEGQ